MKLLKFLPLICLFLKTECTAPVPCSTIHDVDDIRHGVKCFQLSPSPQNWRNAQSHCESINGTIAEPRTKDEFVTLYSFVNYNNITKAWIEAKYITNNGYFVWAPYVRSYNLPPGQLNNNDHKENCVQIYPPTLLNTANCENDYHFVCQTDECSHLFPYEYTILINYFNSNATWMVSTVSDDLNIYMGAFTTDKINYYGIFKNQFTVLPFTAPVLSKVNAYYFHTKDKLMYIKSKEICLDVTGNVAGDTGNVSSVTLLTNDETSMTMEPLSNVQKVKAIVKFLKVDSVNLSSTKRARTSAPDNRPSAQACGGTGIIILSLVFMLILLSDLSSLVQFIKTIFERKTLIQENLSNM